MNKRILSVIVFSAALLSVQAQDGKGGISPAMLGRIQQSYRGTPSDKALRNAIGNNDIRKLALNQENMQDMDTHFSIKVDSKGITDQKSSGRCWLFTGLNVMRAKTLARYGFQSFEFSEIYPFFWDQLEKSNLFLQGIIDRGMASETSVERRRYIHRSGGHRFQVWPCAQERHAGNKQQREYRPYGRSHLFKTEGICPSTP